MKKESLICIGLSLLIVSIYWQTFHFSFIDFDDGPYIIDNPCIQQGFTLEGIKCAFSNLVGGNWCPTISISYMFDYEIYGGIKPGGMHLTNVILHIVNSIIVFFLFKRIIGNVWGSAFIAIIFAIHPQRVESVAWITERKDVLMGLFWLLTIWTYLRYVTTPRLRRFVSVILFYFLALTCKTMPVTLPCVLLLLDFWPLQRFSRKTIGWVVLEKMPLFIMSGVFSIGSVFTQLSSDGIHASGIPLIDRMCNAVVFYLQYIKYFLIPVGLAVYYPPPGIYPFWMVGVALITLTAVSIPAIMWLKIRPWFFIGWAWFLGTLIPVIGIKEYGINFPWADRFMYMPHLGLSMIIALFMGSFFHTRRYPKKYSAIIVSAIMVIFSVLSWNQVSYWRDSVSLFEHAVRVTSGNDFVHGNLGKLNWEVGNHKEAIYHFKKAYYYSPNNPLNLYNMGCIYIHLGKVREAISFFESSIEAYREGRIKKAMLPAAHNNLGILLYNMGERDKARLHFMEAERLKR